MKKPVAVVTKSLYLPLNICTEQKANINVPIHVGEKKVAEMEQEEKKHKICKRCGRKLKNEVSQGIGMGPTCYNRFLAEQTFIPRLFEVKQHEKPEA